MSYNSKAVIVHFVCGDFLLIAALQSTGGTHIGISVNSSPLTEPIVETEEKLYSPYDKIPGFQVILTLTSHTALHNPVSVSHLILCVS